MITQCQLRGLERKRDHGRENKGAEEEKGGGKEPREPYFVFLSYLFHILILFLSSGGLQYHVK